MNSLAVSAIAFACAAGGAALGMIVRAVLPESHLDDDSREVVKLGTGFVGTMAALVLGLLVASASSSFDAEEDAFQKLAGDYVILDRALAHYGPEAKGAREKLRRSIDVILEHLRSTAGPQSSRFGGSDITAANGDLFDAIRDLSPHNDAQRLVQSQLVQIGLELGKTRWNLSQGESSSIPTPFLVVLMFWLVALFAAFGILAPRNTTIVVVLLVCALSVAAAIFLILDLGQPFEGLIRMTGEPLREARARLGR